MLPGVVPFPPEYARRYRDRGYWQDKSLARELSEACTRFAKRTALIDGSRVFSYADIDRLSVNLALNLLALGLTALDRVVVQLPNSAEFVILYVALQKIGAIPIAALPTHRFAEISQFAKLAEARACVAPDRVRDFDYVEMLERVCKAVPTVRYGIVLGEERAAFTSLAELITRPADGTAARLDEIRIDPTDPAVFQLSGGTTGIPKLIPRTHNDYAYNSKIAAEVCDIEAGHTLLVVLPIAHNLPLACPGIQGFFFKGARVVVSSSTRPVDIAGEIERNRVTHLKVVPALLIRFLNDEGIARYDLSSLESIQSGGQRLQPEVRLLAKRRIPSAFIRENFGMGEGLLTFVRRDDPHDVQLETVGRPVSPDDEVRIKDEDGNDVPFGEVGEMWCRGPYTLRGYYGVPDYNARAFSPDGFYKSGDLMRQHASGSYIVEGRKKDLINRGGEKISAEEIENIILSHPAVENVACIAVADPLLGERMCACVQLRHGMGLSFEELKSFLAAKDIAKFKLPEYLQLMPEFPLSSFGKVSKKRLAEIVALKLAAGANAAAG